MPCFGMQILTNQIALWPKNHYIKYNLLQCLASYKIVKIGFNFFKSDRLHNCHTVLIMKDNMRYYTQIYLSRNKTEPIVISLILNKYFVDFLDNISR